MMTNNLPLVSIIIPVYNVQHYIERCIKSIKNQSFTKWELILVDDCSPDECGTIIDKYANADARIISKHHNRNRGPMVARQTGYLMAKGNFIMFCDGDDELPQNAITVLYEAINEKSVDIVVGGIDYVDVKGNRSKAFCSELKYGSDRISIFKSLLRKELKHNLCGRIFKKELFSNYKYEVYDNCPNSEDMVAFFQVIDHCNSIDIIDNTVYYYHQNNTSSSLSFLSEKALASMVYMRSIALEIINKYPQLKKEMYNWLLCDLNVLYPKYNKDKQLDKLINKYGISKYLMLGQLLRFADYNNVFRYIIKRWLL